MDKGLFNRLQGELEAREKSPGLQVADLLVLPESESSLLNWMIRKGQVEFAEVIDFLGQNESCTRMLLSDLCNRGYVRVVEIRGVTAYRVRLAPRRGRALPSNLWAALDDKVGQKEELHK